MNTHETDMVNLRAALACEYAASALRAAHTFESAAYIYGFDAKAAVLSRSSNGVDNLRQAAELLGFKLTEIVNNFGENAATESQATPILSTAGEALKTSPALQDVFENDPGFQRGISKEAVK